MPATIKPLPPEKLRRLCDPDALPFETTTDVEPTRELIGQPRAGRALEFGMGIKSKGYNIYAIGSPGTGRSMAIRDFLQARCGSEPTPEDWVYVYNFDTPHRPRGLALSAGQGKSLQDAMKHLVESMKISLPQVLESFSYREAVRQLEEEFEQKRLALLEPLERKATDQGFGLEETPAGLVVTPSPEAELDPETGNNHSPEEQQNRRSTQRALQGELYDVLRQLRRLEREALERRKEIDREAIDAALNDDFEEVREQYAQQPAILEYLDGVRKDLLDQVGGSVAEIEEEGLEEVIDLRRYEVNLFVDNSEMTGAPVIVQVNPNHENLFGRFEYEGQGMSVSTHFTRMKPGGLHLANGGYLILEAGDFGRQQETWEALLQALRSGEIELRPPRSEGPMAAASLWPEPIPLNVKVVLLGSPGLYYFLYDSEPEFRNLFKVRADFSDRMVRDSEHEQAYAQFISRRCQDEKLRPFDRGAVAKVIEYGSRLAEHQEKLSAQFGYVADLVREADYLAGLNGHEIVRATDVQTAIDGRVERAAYLAEQVREEILEGSLFIATDGCVVGQVNGLTIHEIGEFLFGHPGRITARTFMGDSGVIHIERETDMSGPIHEKGVLTLNAYLGGTYAQKQPLSLNASITFEQNYGGVEGDSAASTELYALLSSLSQVPLNQGIAVTGSVNQRGEIQPIGGVNEKIEGFFDICRARGLTGGQGVIIPASNLPNLMLREDVVQAVAERQFFIWPVHTIDEGIELLTGMSAGVKDKNGDYPAGTLHHAVKARLLEMALELKNFGDGQDEHD